MKVAFHTLGCKVNRYETEAMAKDFKAKGYEVVDEREFADVYVINTCTVTAVADKKSRQYIRRAKKINPDSVVAVTGCYAQIKPEEVSAVDGVDIVAGTNEKSALNEYVAEYMDTGVRQVHIKGYDELDSYDDTGLVVSTENRTRAYIKIQEGCNRFCSYCVIPYARGKVRSRDVDEIIEEARGLIEAGYKEIVLTGINTALYGMEWTGASEKNDESYDKLYDNDDPYGNNETDGNNELYGNYKHYGNDEPYGVEKIIAKLDKLPGNFRIRLSSLEPAVVNAEYVGRLLKYEKLCHHLHLSAQSGSDRVLRTMNRPYSRKEYLEIVRVLRDFDPCYGISTDIIVGFPGEKEADFDDSCTLTEECGFCKTHVFKYSKRPFTKAASMEGHVAPQVKNRRSDELHKAAELASAKFFEENRGRIEMVLTEELHAEKSMVTGYTGNYIRVYIKTAACDNADADLNRMVKVRLTECFADGMKGEIVTSE